MEVAGFPLALGKMGVRCALLTKQLSPHKPPPQDLLDLGKVTHLLNQWPFFLLEQLVGVAPPITF